MGGFSPWRSELQSSLIVISIYSDCDETHSFAEYANELGHPASLDFSTGRAFISPTDTNSISPDSVYYFRAPIDLSNNVSPPERF